MADLIGNTLIEGQNVSSLFLAIRLAEMGQASTLIFDQQWGALSGHDSQHKLAHFDVIDEDHTELHLGSPEKADVLLGQQDSVLSRLIRWGVAFDRDLEGFLAKRSGKRSSLLSAGSHTRLQIGKVLYQQLAKWIHAKKIQILPLHRINKVYTNDKKLNGVLIQDLKNLQMKMVFPNHLVFSEGSLRGFSQHQIAPALHLGHSLSVAYEAGLYLCNMEFFDNDSFSTGGIWSDKDFETNRQGIFTIGDAACLSLGADASTEDTLWEGLMLSSVLAQKLSSSQNKDSHTFQESDIREELDAAEENLLRYFDRSGPENAHDLYQNLQKQFASSFFQVRSADSLNSLLDMIHSTKDKLQRISLSDHGRWMNGEYLFVTSLEKAVELANVMVLSALFREESRGSHLRKDFKETEAHFLKRTKVRSLDIGPELFYEKIAKRGIRRSKDILRGVS